MNEMVREHLRTGYPSLFTKVTDFNKIAELRKKIADELAEFTSERVIENEKVVKYVANFQQLKTYLIPKKYWSEVERIIARIEPKRLRFIKQTCTNYNKKWTQISEELRILSLKVEHGEALQGVCDLCPKSKVSN